MPIRLPTNIVLSSREARTQLSRRVTIGELAAYLTQAEPQIEAGTLEIASRVSVEQAVANLDLAGGDRLAIFVRPPRIANFALPLQAGDVILHITSGNFSANSGGRRDVLVGKPDEEQGTIPDVDLRALIAPRYLDYISRSTLWLNYSPGERRWYASRSGQTRVLLNDFDLTETRIPISDGSRIQFFRGSDDPATTRPLGELSLTLEKVIKGTPGLEPGQQTVTLRLGDERGIQMLAAGDSLSVFDVVRGVLRHNSIPHSDELAVYHLRLVSPQTRLAALDLPHGKLLYAPLSAYSAAVALHLRDAHDPQRTFTLQPSGSDLRLGTRLQPNETVAALDVDLYDALVALGNPPHRSGIRSPFMAVLSYQDRTWWLRSADSRDVSLFVNTARVGNDSVPVTVGDVLTIGNSITRYLARLEVELTLD